MGFSEMLREKKSFVEEFLKDAIPAVEGPHEKLFEAMKYSLRAGGKRLRPILLLEACLLAGGEVMKAMKFACAVEMIHTYSLIHDDLPAMDDDDLRRGNPTNHKVFGEGMAVLAGDGLLNYAFEMMIESSIRYPDQSYKYLLAMDEIAQGAGVFGMIAGQTADLESENREIEKETLDFIHLNKTAQLIIRPMRAGAIIGGASQEQLDKITRYAENIGLAFQIVDDILDIVGDESKLGKNVGSDEQKQKSTYPSMYGIEESKKMAFEKIEEAKNSISYFGESAEFLIGLAEYIIDREL